MESNNETKKIFKRWGHIVDECRNKQHEIDKLKGLCKEAREISGISYDGMPKSNTRTSSVELSALKTICVYEKNIERLNYEIQQLLKYKEDIDVLVSKLGAVEQRIIRMRYADKKAWNYINAMTGYSRRQCFRIHDESVDLLRDKLAVFKN